MKLWLMLLVAGIVLELAHSRVSSGAAGSDSNTIASLEGTLSNLDEVTGQSLRVGFVLIAVAAFLYLRGKV
jgi:hypothetical protein